MDGINSPRSLTSLPLDLSSGGSISFDMVYSIQGAKRPDLPSEGVYLQYSIDGGSTWVTIDYWDPLGGNDPFLTSWITIQFLYLQLMSYQVDTDS